MSSSQYSINRYYPLFIIGMILSLLLCYVLFHMFFKVSGVTFNLYNHSDLTLILEAYYPMTAMVLAIGMMVVIIKMSQIIQQQRNNDVRMHEVNEKLVKGLNNKSKKSQEIFEMHLMQGQKLQAIGTLAGGIAHDFNNILYAIKGYCEMALDDVTKDTITHKNMEKILEATHKGHEFISRILAFSRRQHYDFKTVNLTEVILSATSLLKPLIPSSVEIVFKANVVALIQGNQTLFHQVIFNLINNAIDAMDGTGTVTITVDELEAKDKALQELTAKPSGGFQIKICDTGHGIDPVHLRRIFEPFYTTKEVGKGTGLGLSIVNTIIEEHHGKINVDSQIGKGTCFTIILPKG